MAGSPVYELGGTGVQITYTEESGALRLILDDETHDLVRTDITKTVPFDGGLQLTGTTRHHGGPLAFVVYLPSDFGGFAPPAHITSTGAALFASGEGNKVFRAETLTGTANFPAVPPSG
jgi:hypothetical protein